MIGALKDLVFAANLVWKDGSKDLKVSVKLDDLGIFPFDANCNISSWLDRVELDVTYSLDNGTQSRTKKLNSMGSGSFV